MRKLWGLILTVLLMGIKIWGQTQATAIVKYIEGKAYVQSEKAEERELLTINSPLFEGDNIWVSDGNLGILFNDGNSLWLPKDSHVEITTFPNPYLSTPIGMKVNLWRGSCLVDAKFPVPTEAAHVIVSPSATIKIARRSLAYIEVENVDRTRVTVFDGVVTFVSGGHSVNVWTNQMSYAEYGYEPIHPITVKNLSYPEIAIFREKMTNKNVKNPRSWEYLPPELYAYAIDLDYYGYWEYVPGYGNVWFPSPAYVHSGWMPYYFGYWRYTPWGCTWISYEPWGWIPYHYGHWVFIIGLGWGWIPGIWFSPAWVCWYWGNGWIGWCPWGCYNGIWGPIWYPCGWCKIDINYIYVKNVTKVVVVNKEEPPPVKPITPIPQKAYNMGDEFSKRIPKEGDVLVTPTGGLNLSPTRLKDIQDRKIDIDDAKEIFSKFNEPKKHKIMPSSLDDGEIEKIERRKLKRDAILPLRNEEENLDYSKNELKRNRSHNIRELIGGGEENTNMRGVKEPDKELNIDKKDIKSNKITKESTKQQKETSKGSLYPPITSQPANPTYSVPSNSNKSGKKVSYLFEKEKTNRCYWTAYKDKSNQKLGKQLLELNTSSAFHTSLV